LVAADYFYKVCKKYIQTGSDLITGYIGLYCVLNVSITHIQFFTVTSLLAVARYRLPTTNVPLPLGSKLSPATNISFSQQRLTKGKSQVFINSISHSADPLHFTNSLVAISQQRPSLLTAASRLYELTFDSQQLLNRLSKSKLYYY
jgi:hypothetical protein